MKRRSLPLFVATEPDVFVMDTSAWLNIESRRDREDAWRIVFSLIDAGRLFVCAEVLRELRDDPIYYRLKPYERALLAAEDSNDSIPAPRRKDNTRASWHESGDQFKDTC
jgi:hypothetical protein